MAMKILGLVGAGGMGEVYRARDSVLKREVAIKVLPSFVSQDHDRLRRFEYEAQATAALNHPNILVSCITKTRKRHAVRKMKEGPSEPPCRGRLQTAISCFGQKPRW